MDEFIDEIAASNAPVHLEMMDDQQASMWVGPYQLWIFVEGRGKLRVRYAEGPQ